MLSFRVPSSIPTRVYKRPGMHTRAESGQRVDRLIKQNKRLKRILRKKKYSSAVKFDNRRIILEELNTFMELLDNVIDILSDDIPKETMSSEDERMFNDLGTVLDLYEFCGEIPDDTTCEF